ncbi:hypothetical protein FALBO_8641 [Fusarium albosuccineum]|uniref:Uncharacterized protein n=1 Tax=Fusarium albosuccineum TaxID=1237068 RepID=A0A8H4L956_9HYPO|nr:hypothetical protein FALBO_8641 [Fusarium albosuccineum]
MRRRLVWQEAQGRSPPGDPFYLRAASGSKGNATDQSQKHVLTRTPCEVTVRRIQTEKRAGPSWELPDAFPIVGALEALSTQHLAIMSDFIGFLNNMHPSKLTPTQPNKAIFIDSIAILSDPLSSMSSMFSLVSLLTMAYQVRTPLPCVQERLLTLLHTMSPALRTEGQQGAHAYSREEILNSFIHFLSPVLNGMAGMLELLTAVDAFSRPEDFRQFWTLGHSNLIRDFIESGGPLRGMQGYDVPFLEAFVKDSSCRIALGKNKGMLLLVPGDAEVGDDVWWDEDEQRLTVTRKGEDDLSNDEPYLEDGSRMAVMAIPSAT